MPIKSSGKNIAISLGLSFLIFSMLLNCMAILILKFSAEKISYGVLGSLEIFKDLPIALTSLFAVNIIHKNGSKKALTFALITVCISCLILPVLEVFWFYKIWFIVVGIAFAMAKISVFAILKININSVKKLASSMSFIEASYMLGIFIVNIGFGFLLISQFAIYWKFGFWFISILSLLNILLLRKTNIDEYFSENESQSIFATFKFINKKNIIFFCLIFFIVFIEQNFNAWLPIFFKTELKVNSFFALQSVAFMALFSFFGRLISGRIVEKFLVKNIIYFCISGILILLIICQIIFFYFNDDMYLLRFLLPIIGVFLSPLYPLFNSFFLSITDKSTVNYYISLVIIFSSLGSSIGSLAISFLFYFHFGSFYSIFIACFSFILFMFSIAFFRKFESNKQ